MKITVWSMSLVSARLVHVSGEDTDLVGGSFVSKYEDLYAANRSRTLLLPE